MQQGYIVVADYDRCVFVRSLIAIELAATRNAGRYKMNNNAKSVAGRVRAALNLYDQGKCYALSNKVFEAVHEYVVAKDKLAARNALRRVIEAES